MKVHCYDYISVFLFKETKILTLEFLPSFLPSNEIGLDVPELTVPVSASASRVLGIKVCGS